MAVITANTFHYWILTCCHLILHPKGLNSHLITSVVLSISGQQQLSPLFNSKPQVDAVNGETAKFSIEIYGLPEPSTLTLQKTDDDTNLTSSSRHSVEYTAGVSPFGVVNVTISDVVEADYTNYTLTVDNGVGNALIYTFYLNEGDTLTWNHVFIS